MRPKDKRAGHRPVVEIPENPKVLDIDMLYFATCDNNHFKRCRNPLRMVEKIQKELQFMFTGYRFAQNNINYLIGVGLDMSDRVKAEEEKSYLIGKLQEAMSEVKQLSGLLPICASCKKIRDDKGYWNQIEAYIQKHSEAEFSHSTCNECVEKLYPDLKISKAIRTADGRIGTKDQQ
jgi:hypothetical protein